MPNYSSYLNLIKPFLGEFPDSWDQPWADNMEKIDVFCQELDKALVSGGGTTALYSVLKGTKPSLADRLAVSIYSDGTLNLDNSPSIANLSSSSVNGTFTSPRDRFEFEEFEIWHARSPGHDDRFSTTPTAQGYLDEGLAQRVRECKPETFAQAISSPARYNCSGRIQGQNIYMAGVASNEVVLAASIGSPSSWSVYNIDGYLFRIRQGIVLNMANDSAGTALVNGDIVYLFIQRGDYGNAFSKFKLSSDPGTAAVKDLRRLQEGTDGALSGNSSFSSASAAFSGSSTKWSVLPGDCLVITGGTAAGRYLVDAVPTANSLTIRGIFRATSLSGVSWYIEDNSHPNLGCIKVTDAYADPPVVAGRVYIGRGQLDAGGFMGVGSGGEIAFPNGDVYDSGWYGVNVAGGFPATFEHNLGVLPSHVEIFARESAATESYQPMVARLLGLGGTEKYRVPSMIHYADKHHITVILAMSGLGVVPALFTKSDNTTDVTFGQIRVIARR